MSWRSRDVVWKPLESWPGERTRQHVAASFRSTLGQTHELLDRELSAINHRGMVIIEADLKPEDLRLDGKPRKRSAIPPAIKLNVSPAGRPPITFATDRFTKWDDNLRAIALGMSDLRRIERYGISDKGQQYAGFAALPSSSETPGLSPEIEALLTIAEASGWTIDQVEADPKKAVNRARFRTHPDHGGSDMAFAHVAEAAGVILL